MTHANDIQEMLAAFENFGRALNKVKQSSPMGDSYTEDLDLTDLGDELHHYANVYADYVDSGDCEHELNVQALELKSDQDAGR